MRSTVYEQFLTCYGPRLILQDKENESTANVINHQVDQLFLECGGSTFERGIYRTHNHASSLYWATIIGNFFPSHKDQIIPFGYDWMGRQFAVDKHDETKLLMFDPAIVEAFGMRHNVVWFHNEELVGNGVSQLEKEKFEHLLRLFNRSEIGHNECITHKVPLFLNGKDENENMEIWDNEVYWAFQSQIYLQIKDLPPGTKIDSIRFE